MLYWIEKVFNKVCLKYFFHFIQKIFESILLEICIYITSIFILATIKNFHNLSQFIIILSTFTQLHLIRFKYLLQNFFFDFFSFSFFFHKSFLFNHAIMESCPILLLIVLGFLEKNFRIWMSFKGRKCWKDLQQVLVFSNKFFMDLRQFYYICIKISKKCIVVPV